jgi:ABC-type multidrug transport system ATPase subunit
VTTILEAAGLGKRYGRRWALRDCTLTIPAGQVVGLVGPNGAGKTTLLNLAVGLLMEAVATHGTSVVLSSHLITDIERVCDYLIVLAGSRIQVAGEVSELLASHHQLSGFRRDPGTLPAEQEVITESHTDRQTTLLIRSDAPIHDPAWTVRPVSLEDLVLAYMSRRDGAAPARPRLGVVS